jgi:hypothetical protein
MAHHQEHDVATWEPFEGFVDPEVPAVVRGPVLLTEIEPGKVVDLYVDSPPWEDKAVPTRCLTNRDVADGFLVEHMQQVFAKARVRVRGKRPRRA